MLTVDEMIYNVWIPYCLRMRQIKCVFVVMEVKDSPGAAPYRSDRSYTSHTRQNVFT